MFSDTEWPRYVDLYKILFFLYKIMTKLYAPVFSISFNGDCAKQSDSRKET